MNPGPNYLSAGEIPLPWVYGAECIFFFVAAATWVWWLRSHKAESHRIHHLMTLAIALKVTTLLVESIMYHYIALTGHSTGWNIVFYISTFIRGLVMIGEGGWDCGTKEEVTCGLTTTPRRSSLFFYSRCCAHRHGLVPTEALPQ